MATECYTQLGFGFQPKLVVDFAGGTLTRDAGLLLVREFDEQLGLSADVVGRITDRRDARYVTHDLDALVRQRLYQIAAGVRGPQRRRPAPASPDVPGRGRRLLKERMAPAEGILLNTAGAPAKTLEWYRAMIHLGRVQAWDRQRVDAMPAGRQVPRRFAVYVQMSAVR